jgi:mono/diheme cytochrome c family protein
MQHFQTSVRVFCGHVFLASAAFAAESPVDFARDVAPIFENHCLRCHTDDNAKGELSLQTSHGLRDNEYVMPGKPEESHLLELVTSQGNSRPAMPQQGSTLSAKQRETLRRWIEQGAAWPADIVLQQRSKADAAWWSLQPVRSVPVPEAVTFAGKAVQSDHPIDRFIHAKLAEKKLSPSVQADRRTLIRRLYFDLLGLPPAPEAVADFVANNDPQAYEHLVDTLLQSKHFGERWTRHWLDIAHYADTHGFERDKRRDHAWRYRDYVIQSFNADKPYDQFLREQIAGDVIDPNNDEAVVATGFLAAGPWDFVGQVETKSPVLRRASRVLDLDDMVTQVMTATMAMTVNCARCHDHKLDPITQQEYYQLTAVFAGLQRNDRDLGNEARQQYESEVAQLKSDISEVSLAIGRLEGRAIDLADVVGGGTGFGTGQKGLGLDARTGKTQERPFGDLGNVKPGNYAKVKHTFIDGVFVPANGESQITSTALKATGLPTNSGKAWDMIRNGPVSSQFSTKFGAVDYITATHSMIGLHANAGITFDLVAIRRAIVGEKVAATAAQSDSATLRFTAVAGYGGKPEEPSAEFHIFLDGALQQHQKIGRNDAVPIQVSLPSAAQWLTLISTDGGNGYGHDQISFGDPRIRMEAATSRSTVQQQQLAALRRKQTRLEQQLTATGEPPVFFGVVSETPPAMHVLDRGDPESPGDVVNPGSLAWSGTPVEFGSTETPDGQRRAALADWITSETNPLTARVVVNRLWHWHFGQGIVSTPSDFGFGGGRPSHPELLDWLAAELVTHNWRLKHIHRLIVTSKTYQQASLHPAARPDAASSPTSAHEGIPLRNRGAEESDVDFDNRLLWRMNSRRLEAEAVRDSVLAVSGKLNRQMFGPGYRDFDYQEAYAPIYTYKTADSPNLWRRSVYRFIVRTTPPQFLTTLDCPDPANMTPARNVTTTPLQSLALFNNEFMLKQAEYFAERLQAEHPNDIPKQLARAFDLAFARHPTIYELQHAAPLVRQNGLLHLCRALFNANEFVYAD